MKKEGRELEFARVGQGLKAVTRMQVPPQLDDALGRSRHLEVRVFHPPVVHHPLERGTSLRGGDRDPQLFRDGALRHGFAQLDHALAELFPLRRLEQVNPQAPFQRPLDDLLLPRVRQQPAKEQPEPSPEHDRSSVAQAIRKNDNFGDQLLHDFTKLPAFMRQLPQGLAGQRPYLLDRRDLDRSRRRRQQPPAFEPRALLVPLQLPQLFAHAVAGVPLPDELH